MMEVEGEGLRSVASDGLDSYRLNIIQMFKHKSKNAQWCMKTLAMFLSDGDSPRNEGLIMSIR